MGSFANTLFQMMLGWIQGIVSSVWSAFTDDKGGSFFTWLGNHWIPIVIVLCAAGLIADLGVYLVRWKPYRVWKSFFRRGKVTDETDAPERQPLQTGRETVRRNPSGPASRVIPKEPQARHAAVQHDSLRPDHGSAGMRRIGEGQYQTAPVHSHPVRHESLQSADDQPEMINSAQGQAYRKPDFSQWETEEPEKKIPEIQKAVPVTVTPAGYRVPEDSPYRRPASVPVPLPVNEKEKSSDGREETGILQPVMYKRRRRLNVSELFSDPEEELRTIEAPQHVIDSQKAYHQPVYPRGWKKSEDEQE